MLCGKRVQYYKHYTGLCVLPTHGDDVEHLVEMVTPEPPTGKYHKLAKADNRVQSICQNCGDKIITHPITDLWHHLPGADSGGLTLCVANLPLETYAEPKEPRMTRVLITGSRTWDDPGVIEDALIKVAGLYQDDDITLVSGHCPKGADAIAEDFAGSMGWPIERHPANWQKYGNSAGFVRNCEMIESNPDHCVAFIRGESKGATQTRDMAVFRGVPTDTYIYKEKQVFERYVVGFAFDEDERVALICKERPPWQKGLFNGVGGKIEIGETPLQAMIREFDEETGVLVDNWEMYATLLYPQAEICFFKALVPTDYMDALQSKTDEFIFIFTLAEFQKSDGFVRNLSWLLPLALYDKASYLPINVVVNEFGNEGNVEEDDGCRS